MTVVPLFVSLSAIFVCGAIAQAATEYRAFQIARPSADHVRLEVVSEGLDRLAQVTGRLAIVGVVGAFHSGKSFLLNALLRSLQQPASAGTADSHKASSNQFAVADQVSPKTMGLWLLETDVRLRDGSRVVLLDSEGFFAHNVDESYDAEVFTIAALASSTLIFNAVSVIDQAAVEHLEILARRAQLFQVKSAFRSSDNVSDPQFQVEFPHLIVAVEDFVQSLGALSADQWLEQYLAGHRDKSNAAAVDAASIHDVFPKGVACKTLFLPSTELDDLQHLNIDSSPLTKRFLDDVFELRDMVLAKTSAKVSQANVELGVGDGRATAALLHFLLAHINKDTFPSVPSLWSAWLTDLQRHSETEVKAFVADRLAHYIDGAQPPRSQAEFDAHAVQVLQQAESFLKSMLFGIESVYGIVLAQLRRFAADQQRQLAARNAQTIVAYVEQVAKELAARAERHSLHVPLDPALIDAESARTLAEVGALFAAQTNKYGGAAAQPAIESQRQLLTHGVAQTFAALAAANERRLAAIFDGALIKCADAFKLTQATALVELPKALPEAGEPLLTGAQIEQLATACDDACDKAAAEHCSNEGKVNVTVHAAWLSRMAVYSTYAAASTERKNVLRHALRTSNTENVCRYANKQSSKYAEEARAAVDQIFPFPDEEEIVAGKVAPLLEQATHRFTAHLAPLVQFACVSDNRVLNSALTAIHEDKLRYNLDAVKAAAHSALEKCAKPLVVALNCGMFCAASLSAWTFESRATAIALACFDKDVAARKFTDSLRRKVAARWLHTDMSSIFTDIAWRQRVVFASINVTLAATISVWVHPFSSSALGYLVFKKGTFAVALQDQEVVVAFGNLHPGWKWIHSEWRAPLNEWSNIAVTYSEDVQQCCIYSNGVLRKVAEVRGPLASCDNALQVGVKSFKKTGNSKTRYIGLIADVRLYDRPLLAADISTRWGLPTSASERGLVGWWPFDEGTGDTVWDRTVHAQHGEVMGPKWHMGVVVPPSTLSTQMLAVLRDGIGADVTLRAGGDGSGVAALLGSGGDDGGGGAELQHSGGGDTVRAHRAILAARCEVFRAMFTIGMKEASQETVVLSDIQPHTLQMLIEYLYSDELDIPSEFAVDLFIVADRYRLERLQRMCECVILNSLSTDNVCHILETADALNALQLRGIAFRWIIHHFGDVLKSPGFIDLDKSLQREVSVSASQMHFGKRSAGSAGAVSRSNSANNDAQDDD